MAVFGTLDAVHRSPRNARWFGLLSTGCSEDMDPNHAGHKTYLLLALLLISREAPVSPGIKDVYLGRSDVECPDCTYLLSHKWKVVVTCSC